MDSCTTSIFAPSILRYSDEMAGFLILNFLLTGLELFYDRWQENKLPDSWEYIPSLITDNPYLPQGYLDNLRVNMTPQDYRKFVEGDWTVYKVNNAFATQFDENRHVSIMADFDPKKQLIISIDFNLNPFAVTFYHHSSEGTWLVDEAQIENGNVPLMVDLNKGRYKAQLPNAILTGDAMGNRGDISQRDNATLYLQLLRGLGMRESQLKVANNPTHENSRADVNYLLYHKKDFFINPKCKNSIYDLKYVECDEHGKIKKANRKELNQRGDFLDCFRYFVHNIMYSWIESHHRNVYKS